MNNTRVIRVTGKGIIQIKPDTTKLTITLQGNSKEYAEAVKRSTEETDSLKDTLASLGFSKSGNECRNGETPYATTLSALSKVALIKK